jgi:hypothetical protein
MCCYEDVSMRSVDAKCRCEDMLMRRYIDGKVYPSSIQLTDSNYLLSRHFFSVTTINHASHTTVDLVAFFGDSQLTGNPSLLFGDTQLTTDLVTSFW